MIITNTIPVIWQNSVLGFEKFNTKYFYADVNTFVEAFNKEFSISDIEFRITQLTKHAKAVSRDFIIKLHLHLKSGKRMIATGQDRHLGAALKKAINGIHRQSQLSDRQKHNALGRHHSQIKSY